MRKKDIFVIISNIAVGAMNIIGGIVDKDFYEFMLGVLFLIFALAIYVFAKSLEIREELIDKQDELISTQNKTITNLLKDLATPRIVIDIDLIKIPKKFTKPKKEKLSHRIEYYNKNKCFEVPIIIDASNMLVDGYTSYLIAKKYNLKTVQAKVKIGG